MMTIKKANQAPPPVEHGGGYGYRYGYGVLHP